MNETRKRSIAKAVTYRIVCIIMLAVITYVVTEDLLQMTSVVVIFQSIRWSSIIFMKGHGGRLAGGIFKNVKSLFYWTYNKKCCHKNKLFI